MQTLVHVDRRLDAQHFVGAIRLLVTLGHGRLKILHTNDNAIEFAIRMAAGSLLPKQEIQTAANSAR